MSLHAIIPAIAEDGSLYRIGKLEAHEKGALHLAISVFVFDGEALLIQKRAAEKYHCPGLWANTACSHPHWGEAAPAAAARRLREELGCTLPLECRGETTYRADVGGGLWEHEQVTLFRGEADRRSLVLAPDPAEVSETRWATLPDLHAEIAATPDAFAPWFRIYMTRWRDLDLQNSVRMAMAQCRDYSHTSTGVVKGGITQFAANHEKLDQNEF